MPSAKHMPSDRPRFGIIGTGQIVQMIRPALTSDPSLSVVAIAGRTHERTTLLAESFGGITACADYRELLELDLDAVFIATPPNLHAEMSEAALSAGVHVVCEKPLICNLDELSRVEAAHRRTLPLRFASCSSRFFVCPPVRRARELIASGVLGRVVSVRLHVASEFPPPLTTLSAWKLHWSTAGGGLLMDWGPYDLDWMRFLLGERFRPISVSGSIDHWRDGGSGLETGYIAHIRCEGGLTISIERQAEHGPAFQRAEIRGTHGGLDLPFMPGGFPDTLVQYCRTPTNSVQRQVKSKPMCDWSAVLAFPVSDMANAIIAEREVASPISAQRSIYEVIDALYKSATNGQSVPVSPGVSRPSLPREADVASN